MKIYLLRHGESTDDIEDCYGGIADFPLTNAGREIAQKLADKVISSGIQVLYSSPYKRAHETAIIVAQMIECEVKVITNLRERNSYGVLSAVNKKKAREAFAHVLNQLTAEPGDYYSDELVPGAEPKDEFDNRVREAFNEIVKITSENDIIGIVTHGNVIRSIGRHIIGKIEKVELEKLTYIVINYKPAIIEIEHMEGIKIKK